MSQPSEPGPTMASVVAADAYNARVTHIRATMDQRTRAYADAMSKASAEYKAAMVKAIGHAPCSHPADRRGTHGQLRPNQEICMVCGRTVSKTSKLGAGRKRRGAR